MKWLKVELREIIKNQIFNRFLLLRKIIMCEFSRTRPHMNSEKPLNFHLVSPFIFTQNSHFFLLFSNFSPFCIVKFMNIFQSDKNVLYFAVMKFVKIQKFSCSLFSKNKIWMIYETQKNHTQWWGRHENHLKMWIECTKEIFFITWHNFECESMRWNNNTQVNLKTLFFSWHLLCCVLCLLCIHDSRTVWW